MLCMLLQTPVAAEPVYVVDVLLYLAKETAHSSRTGDVRPYTPGGKGEMQVGCFLINCEYTKKFHSTFVVCWLA